MSLRVLLGLLLLWPASFLHAAPAPATEIPFQFVDGFIILDAQIEPSGQPLHLLLDSGAGVSVLSLDTARRLRLDLGSTQPVQGVGLQALAHRLEGVTAKAAGVTLGQTPLALDLRNAAKLCRQPIDGLIGADFFAKRIVEIDYAQRRIRLLTQTNNLPAEVCRLPIKPFHGTLCIPISVNGSKPRWARLDTGCNDSLHWVVPRTTTRDMQSNPSIGFLTDASDTVLSEVRLGDEDLPNIQTSLHAKPLFPGEAGLVGSGLLSRHIVTIDLVHNQLLLRSNGTPSEAYR